MPSKLHLWPETRQIDGDLVEVAARLEIPLEESRTLWFRLPAEFFTPSAQPANALLLGTLFNAMRRGLDLHVHDDVCPVLLRNLDEFQRVWSAWFPQAYRVVELSADTESRSIQGERVEQAVAAFSGGLDSSFTLWRHHFAQCGRQRVDVRAGMFVHGFDIPLQDDETFVRAARNADAVFADIGLPLIRIATNFREVGGNWFNEHGAGIASCLHLLSGRFDIGLIGSSPTYERLESSLRCGSNPLTDRMLSSDHFSIRDDGAAFTRTQKSLAVATWPESLRRLRVCWQNRYGERNCGRCEKCIRSVLSFRAVGVPTPPSFEHEVTNADILRLKGLSPVHQVIYRQLVETARRNGINESWVRALEWRLRASALKGGVQAIANRAGLWT